MVHELYQGTNIARSALAALRNQSTLARIVNREYSSEIIRGVGGSVDIKRPIMVDPARVYTEANRAAGDPITYSNLYEPYVSVKVTDQVYNAVPINDFDNTFTFSNLETQVVAPMADSVADGINGIVADAFKSVDAGLTALDRAGKGKLVGANGTAYDNITALREADTTFVGFGNGTTVKAGQLTAATNADALKVLRAARQLFRQRGVPNQNRYMVVGSGWEAALLSQDLLTKVNESGSSDQLRLAEIGRLYGFTILVDDSIDPYKAYAFQRDGIALVTALTATPRGAAYATTANADGFTMRYIHDYDVDHLTDRAVVDTFAGAQVLDPQRIAVLTGTEGFEEKADAPAGGETGGE
ncbi:hypothetical protein [Corynebacterium sp. AOP12-C2-36]|uniref:hypothetical protein n=1 Tax=Corynebacterium sp. AOP12-C2-36 TaxID=3457723 RepID=UPI004033B0EF